MPMGPKGQIVVEHRENPCGAVSCLERKQWRNWQLSEARENRTKEIRTGDSVSCLLRNAEGNTLQQRLLVDWLQD